MALLRTLFLLAAIALIVPAASAGANADVTINNHAVHIDTDSDQMLAWSTSENRAEESSCNWLELYGPNTSPPFMVVDFDWNCFPPV